MNARHTLIALVGAATLFGGCACAPSDLAGIPSDDGAVAVVHEPATTVDESLPLIRDHLYPDGSDAVCSSHSPGGIDLPCRDVVAVCVVDAFGQLAPKWPGLLYDCDATSPTWRTVCTTRPEVEWSFYGYTPEECAEAVTGT